MSFKKILLTILSGVLLGCSQPIVIETLGTHPVDATGLTGLLAFIGFIPAILAARQASPTQAFFIGLLSGSVQYSIIVYWIYIALHIFGGIAFLPSMGVLLLLALVLGFYGAVAYGLAALLSRHYKWAFWCLFPIAMSAVEYLRNYIFVGGFPWGNVGYSLATLPLLVQAASLVGVYGLVFCIVLFNSAVAEIIQALRKRISVSPAVLVTVGLLTSVWVGYGYIRLYIWSSPSASSVKLGLLQGNIEQGIKNHATLFYSDIMQSFRELQNKAVEEGAQVVIWPEAAYPLQVGALQQEIAQLAHPAPVHLLGAVIRDKLQEGTSIYGDIIFHNSVLIVDNQFKIRSRYDKSHLVPFGEYVPWPFRPIVDRVVPGMGAFSPGVTFQPFALDLKGGPAVKAGITICYEGVFPEISRAFVRAGANIMINMTNDAWYGVSSAPYQHLNMYVLRAVENGRNFVRATNTGVSAFIDSRGYISHATELYEKKLIIGEVGLRNEITLYTIIGDKVPQIAIVFLMLAFLIAFTGKDVLKRRRAWLEWLLGALGIGGMLGSYVYFSASSFATDESARSKMVVWVILSFVLGVGALSGKAWGRRAICWTSGILALLSGAVAWEDGKWPALFGVMCGVLFLLVYLRSHAYANKKGH